MKPFDLDRAVAGDPLVTRDGRLVTDFHYFSTAKLDCPVAAVIGRDFMTYTRQGRWGGPDSPADLFMAPAKQTVYANIMSDGCAAWFNTQDAAQMAEHTYPVVARAVPIEIEV